MFHPPAQMQHVLVQSLTEDLPNIALALAEVGIFATDPRSAGKDKFPEVPGEKYRHLFKQAQSRFAKIASALPVPPLPPIRSARIVEESELERLNAWLGDVWATSSSYEEQFHRLAEEERLIGLRESALANFADLNVDLSLLHSDRQFLNLLVGTLPTRNLQKLEEAMGLERHMVYTFLETPSTVSVVIVGQRSDKGDTLASALQAAAFQPLTVPADLRSQPDKIREEIQAQRAAIAEERQKTHKQLERWGASLRQDLEDAQRSLILAEPFVLMDTAMRSAGNLGTITGWVPKDAVKKLETAISQRVTNPFLLTVRSPKHSEQTAVPTVMQPSPWFAPFQEMVKQYGVPRYGEVDPTPFFAPTFILMFGAMFGDVGQGGVLALAGWYFRKSLGDAANFMIYIGLSSVAFGFLYGSIFGFEDVVIHHIWVSPLHDPPYMLAAGILWGVTYISLASAVSMYNHYIEGAIGHAIFGHHGAMSIVLFLAVIFGLFRIGMGGEFGMIPTAIAVLALGAISAHEWHEMHGTPAIEKVMVVLIGALEIFLGYISNTLSFLRVAAFSVNHAALAMSVFAIAKATGEVGGTGYWISVVIGNIFIMVMEGAVVVIQTLRLEYYEGFSRYYSGDGREYKPITLATSPVA